MLDSARWDRVQTLFHGAADLPPSEQRAYLESQCAGDRTLITDVLSLLEEDARGSSLLDRDVAHVARDVLGGAEVPSFPPGAFGPYRIRQVLGEGGMGVVYLAERDDLGSSAAIKILRDAWLSPARRERFAIEQRTLAQLNHPSIARLYDANTLPDGTPWFVMEYVEGQPLTTYCRTRGASITERLRLFRHVCEAVEHAHRHLVIHRDLKPSNILVAADGSVKLLDFGISKHLESADAPVDQTRTGLRLMTPAYAAPEQIRGLRVGVHTDIYSLGVVLYELLVGRLPFDLSDRTPAEALSLVAEQEPERPSVAVKRQEQSVPGTAAPSRSVSAAAWADLDVLCLTAMHKDPQRRYRSAEALIRDVDHFLGREPLEARPDTLGYRLGKFLGRNWRQVSAATFATLVMLGLGLFYTIRLATARNTALAEAARTERIQGFMLNLFQGGDAAVGPADSLRVVTLLDRGVQDAKSLDAEPAIQAALYETLGGIYQKLGNLARADTLLQLALARRRSWFGADNADVASSLVALGLLRLGQAEFPEAERLAREGLAMTRRHLPITHPAVARATTALGQVLEEKGSYPEGITVLEEAVRLRSAPGTPPADLAASIRELANTHFYAGHYAIADSLDRVVLAMTRKANGERHPLVAEDLINLGAVQQEWGHYVEAERYHRRALDIVRAFYGDSHFKTAASLTMVGRALVAQRRYDEATEMLRQALVVRERVFGPRHPLVASTVNELGNIALRRERYDEAEGYFSRMVDIYRAAYNGKHYLIGIAQANLASVFLARKENRRAEETFRDALAMYAKTLPPDHLNVGITSIKLGRAVLRQGRYAEAEKLVLAGYQIVSKQAAPTVSWLTAAREDLAAAYDALGRKDDAEKFRTELKTVNAAAAATKK
jgi:serine/threonine-protein kinase